MQKNKTLVNKAMKAMLVAGFAASVCPAPAFAGGSESMFVQAQQNSVRGTVVDEFGEPMIGVTVKLVGTQAATVTDLNGAFTLTSAKKGTQVEFGYIGYKTKVMAVGNGNLQVKMEPDTQMMDEVVVVGYGTVKKKDLTGAVTSMKSEDITIAPTGNAMEALQGKVAGMDISVTSGQIGSDPEILLRGSRSIYGSNEPLFIIDGVPGSYSQVNPSDIETVDVLKDASSTAIYGSAGANGVVIITTKRGKEGKATVNFDAYYGFSGTPNFRHGMTGDEWVGYQKEAYRYKYGKEPESMSVIFNNDTYLDAYENGKWIDWVDEVSGTTATTQKYSLSVTAGGKKTKIYAAANYSKDQGLLENDNRSRYQIRLNIDQELFSWAKVGFTSNLSYTNRNAGVKNTYTKALSVFPLGDAYNADGSIRHEYISGQYTPLGDFIENQYANNIRTTYVNTTGYLELTPLKGLCLRSQVSGTMNHSRQGMYWGAQCNANRPSYAGSPHAEKRHSDGWSYLWENILNYKLTVAKDHDFGATFITSWQKSENESTLAGGSGQDMDKWLYDRLMSATSQHIESDFSQTQKMSYALRFNYAYKGKYLLNLSNRWDGVSWFSNGHKWDSFFAAAVAWRISDEKFMESTRSWLDNLKLRVGYGVTGNSGGIGAYSTATTPYVYTASGITINGKVVPFAQYTGTVASADLGWEKSYNWNFGLDFAVLGGRIDGSLEYFTTKTKGLLYSRTVPITSGLTGWGAPLKMWQNLAETSNHGFEATVNSRNIKTKDFTWNTSLSVSWSKEKIDALPDGDLIAESLFEGQPIKSHYGYKYLGLWQTTDDADLMKQYGVKPGFIKVETIEQNGDGGVHKYGEKDRMILGHQNPDWILGLNNTFAYKGFDLSVFFMARIGQTISSSLLGWYDAKQSVTTNQLAGVDYWTEDNQGAFYPRPGTGAEQATVYSSLRYRDGSFIKLKNITLGYTLPKSITRKALIEKLRFYVTAYNPVIWTMDEQLKDTDPEMNGADAFPTYRQFVFGVNVTF
ncbi:MAG: TonB-dependent receptor [Bacteroidales bacterium]|nr:TonB-dependent receptor [Bacteroidales bacterium]MCM1147895.1 TonB-dependent receptor [Bacteroidales bacterium]MCM1206738.1 TonB-dependent receptor [Bacillota bacterium]MCM1510933.1 TonB-dependent receptor [Clostridium sp.]